MRVKDGRNQSAHSVRSRSSTQAHDTTREISDAKIKSSLGMARVFLVSHKTLALIFVYRLFMTFSLRTAESPDEWWQSGEVAYYLVFGHGHLSWEWKEGIRSVFFPAVYALPFLVLKWLGLDNAYTIHWAERLTQTFIAVGVDYTIIATAGIVDRAIAEDAVEDNTVHDKKDGADVTSPTGAAHGTGKPSWVHSPSVTQTVTALAMMQFYVTYAGPRAYSNVAEGFLVMLALLQGNYFAFLFVAGVACMVRVTAFVALVPIFAHHATQQVQKRGVVCGITYCLVGAAAIAAVIIVTMMSVDYVFYRRWILTPMRFVQLNIVMNISELFGVYPWWFYFVLSFPFIVGVHVVFLFLVPVVLRRMAAGGSRAKRTRAVISRLTTLLLWTISVHSLVPHKENRFLFSMLPIALILISFVLAAFVRFPLSMNFLPVGRSIKGQTPRYLITPRRVRRTHQIFLVVNVVMIVILNFLYRQGGIGIMTAVRDAPQQHFGEVDVMTHCYFTPGYTHVHGKVTKLRLMDCSVELDNNTRKPLITEDVMYREHPVEFVSWFYQRRLPAALSDELQRSPELSRWLAMLEEKFPADHNGSLVLPDAIIVFSHISEALADDFFRPSGYVLQSRVFHTVKSLEPAEGPYVDLWVKAQ